MKRRPLNPVEYAEIARRRWIWILVPALVVSASTYLVARRLPKLYASEALILVEPQRVPTALVAPTVSSDVADLLENIQEQILSRTQLSQIIQKFGLYRNRGLSQDGQVARMSADITVTPIASDDRKQDISAIRIAYQGPDPLLAQQVTRELSNLFLSENLKARAEEAEGTAGFIAGQLQQAQTTLQALESQLTQLKNQYMGSLPEQQGSNLTLLAQMQTVLQTNADSLARAQQQRTYLLSLGQAVAGMSQATINALAPTPPSQTEQALRKARTDLATDEQLYTAAYPGVIQLKAQVAALTAQVAAEKAAPAVAPPAAQPATGSRLASAAKGGAPPAPGAAPARGAGATVRSDPDQSVINLLPLEDRSQIAVLDQEIRQRIADQAATQAKVNVLQADIERFPEVEEKLTNLQNAYDVAKANYTTLLEKQQAAVMGAAMEQQAEGAEFRVVDPANLPQKPSSPDLPRIQLLGVLAGLLAGVGLGLLAEMRDPVARSEADLNYYANAPMLAALPLIPRQALPPKPALTSPAETPA